MKHFDISAATRYAQKSLKSLGRFVDVHRPEVMAATGICGYLSSLYLMYKAAPKIKQGIEDKDPKTVAVAALPVVASAAVATVAVVGSVKDSKRRLAAMTAAYNFTDAAFTEYRDSAKEVLSDKKPHKEEDISYHSADKEIKQTPPNNVIDTGHGSTLCYERLTGRYFLSDINFLKSAVNRANESFDDDYDYNRSGGKDVFLSELHEEMDLEDSDMDRMIGWTSSYGRIKVDYSSHLAPDGTPCLALSYRNMVLLQKVGDEDYVPLDIYY